MTAIKLRRLFLVKNPVRDRFLNSRDIFRGKREERAIRETSPGPNLPFPVEFTEPNRDLFTIEETIVTVHAEKAMMVGRVRRGGGNGNIRASDEHARRYQRLDWPQRVVAQIGPGQ